MSISNVLRCLNIIENLLCVYRNNLLFGKNQKYVAKFRVLVETILILIFSAYMIQDLTDKFKKTNSAIVVMFNFGYVIFVGCSNLGAILLANYSSSDYKKLVYALSEIEKLCVNDLKYENITKKLKNKCYITIVVAGTAINVLSILYLYDLRYNYDDKFRFFIVILGCFLEYRFYCESVVYYVMIYIFVELIKYLNQSILIVKTTFDPVSDGILINDETRGIGRQLELCGEMSRLLGTACDRLQDCFGAQIALSMYSETIFYITLLYQGMLFFKHEEIIWAVSFGDIILTLTVYVSINFLILVGGQHFQNEAQMLDANLAGLHNSLITSQECDADDCARAARALSRRLRAAPLRVRLFRALPVRAAALVNMLALVLNYTIVLLQFNHVI